VNPKQLFISIAEYAFCLTIFLFVDTGIHEWSHLTILRLLGGDGYIIKTPFGAGVVWTQMPTHPLGPLIVSFGGGIGAAIIMLIIIIWDLWDDVEEAAAAFPIFTRNLVYGIYEGLFILNTPRDVYIQNGMVISNLAFVVGVGLGILLFVYKVIWDV